MLKANARAVFEDEPASAPEREAVKPPFWQRFLAAFRPAPALAAGLASLAFGVSCSYQLFVLVPKLKREVREAYTATALPSFALTGRTRGENPTIPVPHEARFFSVTFDVAPGTPYPEYHCNLKDARGSTRFTVSVPPPPAGQPITILLPARQLTPGKYDLVLTGLRTSGNGETQVEDYGFNVR
jgi:hypothetical protein